jgi:hypothetical protein
LAGALIFLALAGVYFADTAGAHDPGLDFLFAIDIDSDGTNDCDAAARPLAPRTISRRASLLPGSLFLT